MAKKTIRLTKRGYHPVTITLDDENHGTNWGAMRFSRYYGAIWKDGLGREWREKKEKKR